MAQNNFDINAASSRFYVDALIPEIDTIWGKIPYADLPDLCYRGAIASYRDSSETNITERQNLLYEFLRGPFAADKPSDPLNLYRRLLPSKSFVGKVTNNLCLVYKDSPTRTFTTNDSLNKIFQRYYQESDADLVLRYAYEQATLQNFVLVRPYWNWENEAQLQVLLPDTFVALFRNNSTKLDELWIAIDRPSLKEGKKAIFQIWTDESVWYADADGERVGASLPNRYGIIPYVPLQMNKSQSKDDPLGGGLWELIEANLIDNTLRWQGMNNVMFNSFSVWVSTNMQWGKDARLHPGRLIDIKDATAGGTVNPLLPPSLDAVGPDGQYPTINEYRRDLRSEALRDLGIPAFLASERGGSPPSGLALVIEYLELFDRRRTDLVVLSKFEKKLAVMTSIVARVDQGERGLPDLLPDFGADFPEARIVQDPTLERTFDAQNVAAGLMRIEAFVAKWEGLDKPITEQEAIDRLKKRQTNYADVMPMLDKLTGTPSAQPTPSIPGE